MNPDGTYPTTSEGLVLAGDGPAAGQSAYTRRMRYKVFGVLRNPKTSTLTRQRRLARAGLRVIPGGWK
jgi:hypothetical protein